MKTLLRMIAALPCIRLRMALLSRCDCLNVQQQILSRLLPSSQKSLLGTDELAMAAGLPGVPKRLIHSSFCDWLAHDASLLDSLFVRLADM